MKRFLYLGAAFAVLYSAAAEAGNSMDAELTALREEVKVLQRQMYRNNDSAEREQSSATADAQKKLSEWEETMRQYKGKLDETEYKMKQLEQKMDKLNRDIEIRFKILEGRQVPAELTTSTVNVQPTYDAPVASKGAKAVVGDNISSNELKPLQTAAEIAPAAEPKNENSKPADTSAGNNNAKVEEMYATAMQAYNGGYFDEAELAFENIMKKYPKHNLAGNAQYWLGEVYVKQGNLSKAKVAFKNGYEKYKNGNKAADSLYRLGVVLSNMKEDKNACIVFNSFEGEFPKANADLKSKVAAEAKKHGC